METKTGYILIAGSASEDCDGERLKRALRFVRNVTTAVLDTGNSVSVLATDEPTRTENGVEVPIAFDWEVLRTVDRYVQSRPGGYAGRILVRAATGADSETKRFDYQQRQLIRRLQDKKALKFHYIPEDLYSGGDYRNRLVDMSDGMIAIGGGKGTYIAGDMMIDAGKPVMPMDIRIGASRGTPGACRKERPGFCKESDRLGHVRRTVNSRRPQNPSPNRPPPSQPPTAG